MLTGRARLRARAAGVAHPLDRLRRPGHAQWDHVRPPPATIATGQGSLLTDNAFSVSDQFLTAKQNGRGILLLGRGGGGLSAVWGPMSAGWPGRWVFAQQHPPAADGLRLSAHGSPGVHVRRLCGRRIDGLRLQPRRRGAGLGAHRWQHARGNSSRRHAGRVALGRSPPQSVASLDGHEQCRHQHPHGVHRHRGGRHRRCHVDTHSQ